MEATRYGKAILVKGETKPHSKKLGKQGLGGSWNPSLKGWIFPSSKLSDLEESGLEIDFNLDKVQEKKGKDKVSDKKTKKEDVIEISKEDLHRVTKRLKKALSILKDL